MSIIQCSNYSLVDNQILKNEDKAATQAVLHVSQLMVDCLVENVLSLDENSGKGVGFLIHRPPFCTNRQASNAENRCGLVTMQQNFPTAPIRKTIQLGCRQTGVYTIELHS